MANGLHFIKFITLKRCDTVATATKKKKSTVKKNLVIVESPAKAKTIEKYLGRNYKVLASVGHIRDLKKSSMSVDIEIITNRNISISEERSSYQ